MWMITPLRLKDSPSGLTFLGGIGPSGVRFIRRDSPSRVCFIWRDSPSGVCFIRRDSPSGVGFIRRDSPSGLCFIRRDSPSGVRFIWWDSPSGVRLSGGTVPPFKLSLILYHSIYCIVMQKAPYFKVLWIMEWCKEGRREAEFIANFRLTATFLQLVFKTET